MYDSFTLNTKYMINVTKLNGKTFVLNALHVESVESFPDTTITLANGNKYVVKEKEEEVVKQMMTFYKTINLFGHQQLGEGQ